MLFGLCVPLTSWLWYTGSWLIYNGALTWCKFVMDEWLMSTAVYGVWEAHDTFCCGTALSVCCMPWHLSACRMFLRCPVFVLFNYVLLISNLLIGFKHLWNSRHDTGGTFPDMINTKKGVSEPVTSSELIQGPLMLWTSIVLSILVLTFLARVWSHGQEGFQKYTNRSH